MKAFQNSRVNVTRFNVIVNATRFLEKKTGSVVLVTIFVHHYPDHMANFSGL